MFKKGSVEEAIAVVKRGLVLTEEKSLWKLKLAVCYAIAGRRNEAVKIAEELGEESKHRYISPFRLSDIYGKLGERDKYFEYMEKVYQERHWIMGFHFAPGFDDVRSDPRFKALLIKVGLKE